MSAENRYENQQTSDQSLDKSKVKLTDLLSRLNQEKRKKKNEYCSLCCSSLHDNSLWNYTFSLKRLIKV